MKPRRSIRAAWLVPLLAVATLGAACNKPVVYAKDRNLETIAKTFKYASGRTWTAAKEALQKLDYKIEYENEAKGILRTGWESTKAGSHYVALFGRKDYGTTGSYYQLQVKVTALEEADRTEIEVAAPVRSIIGNQKSAYTVERKFLRRVADILRKEDFEISNVGAHE